MLEQYYRIDRATGVGVYISQDGTPTINACSISVKGNQLDLEQRLVDLKSLEELSKYVTFKTCIALNLSGKGILHKHVSKIEQIDHNNFSSVLPNANLDDFYVQNFISGELSFISLIRKSEADKWVKEIEDLMLLPVLLSIGPFPVANVLSQLNTYGSELVFAGHKITVNDKSEWLSYKFDPAVSSPFPLKLESEVIDKKLLIPYAMAFQLVLWEKVDPIKAHIPAVELIRQDVLENRKFKVNGILVLCLFFVLLSLNFIVLSALNSKNAELSVLVNKSADNSTNVTDLTEQIKQKEGLLEELGWDGGINKSLLIDRLAATLPGDIIWTSLSVNPMDLKISREVKTIKFVDRTIQITGNTLRIVSLNEWLATIKGKPWVKDVQLEKYSFNNEINTGQFTVLIKY